MTVDRCLRFGLVCLAIALSGCGPEVELDELSTASAEVIAPPIRVMTYNIHHASFSSLSEIANVAMLAKADIIGLQEVDRHTVRTLWKDQAAVLASKLGFFHVYFPAKNIFLGGSSGLALLSRFPILSAERVLLPSKSEQRILVIAEIRLSPTRTVRAGVTHFGLGGAEERVPQANRALSSLGNGPVLLMGDFNERPGQPAYEVLATRLSDAWKRGGDGGWGRTFPATLPDRRIDWVLLGSAWTGAVDTGVPAAASQSDHRPVVAKLSMF
jgi:endonuclease/exonuclease/phosphatase family metal-dependent hydrolase